MLLHAPFDTQSVHIAILSTCFKLLFCIFVIQIWQYKIIQNDESNEFLLQKSKHIVVCVI